MPLTGAASLLKRASNASSFGRRSEPDAAGSAERGGSGGGGGAANPNGASGGAMPPPRGLESPPEPPPTRAQGERAEEWGNGMHVRPRPQTAHAEEEPAKRPFEMRQEGVVARLTGAVSRPRAGSNPNAALPHEATHGARTAPLRGQLASAHGGGARAMCRTHHGAAVLPPIGSGAGGRGSTPKLPAIKPSPRL
eukprot:969015-Prymnesium_polylepis.2